MLSPHSVVLPNINNSIWILFAVDVKAAKSPIDHFNLAIFLRLLVENQEITSVVLGHFLYEEVHVSVRRGLKVCLHALIEIAGPVEILL